ncbi:MAG: hypothetical protein JXB39_04680 [Deltaproteobacteria bacterium]|nr:hypothetical protein [Deltaproteobacteria bacterium]
MRILLLWHMHQPDYRSLAGDEDVLPWVRLHALADYYDMARLAAEAPASVRLTFNLTPILLDQLDALATRGPRDRLYRLCRRPVHRLGPDDRKFLSERLFSVNVERFVRSFPAYERLHRQAGSRPGAPDVPERSDADWIDLEVLFHLAWSGRTLREDPFVAHLLERLNGGFTEDERNRLLDVQDRFLRGVIPLYRRLWEENRIEVSTSPLHHPILPLVWDTAAAREADPEADIGPVSFRCPEDAREQVVRGRERVRALLGREPAGLWPSEGSLSDPVIRMLDDLGIVWTASDRRVLQRSLEAGDACAHMKPWRLDGTRHTRLFFRDTELSDRIGFTYAHWRAQDAVVDLLDRVRARRAACPDHGCLPIILDGENAWEYYENRGFSFLKTLYEALAESPDLDTATFSEAAGSLEPAPLPHFRAGSWIDARFATWIGHPEKTRAWALLQEARDPWEHPSRQVDSSDLDRARDLLLRAEGSDGFWWLGDDHPSSDKAVFDALFRATLSAAWAALGRTPPAALDRPISDPETPPDSSVLAPSARIRPRIDGLCTGFYEWAGAGTIDPRPGAMAASDPVVVRLDFGFDDARLFLRAWPATEEAPHRLARATVRIHLEGPHGGCVLLPAPDGRLVAGGATGGRHAADRVWEAAVDLGPLGVAGGNRVRFHLEILLPDGPAQRVPADGEVEAEAPGPDFDLLHWSV